MRNRTRKVKKTVLTAVVRGPKSVRTQVKKHVPRVMKRVQDITGKLKRRAVLGRKAAANGLKKGTKKLLTSGRRLR